MISVRDVENLPLNSIKNILLEKVKTNDVIISNASTETYKIKRIFSSTVLSYLSLLFAAALLSGFVFYEEYKRKYFYIVMIISQIVLIIFTITMFLQYKQAYLRQKDYRDINFSLTKILSDLNLFIYGNKTNKTMQISLVTIESFVSLLLNSFHKKNKRLWNLNTFKEYSVFLVMILILLVLITVALFCYLGVLNV